MQMRRDELREVRGFGCAAPGAAISRIQARAYVGTALREKKKAPILNSRIEALGLYFTSRQKGPRHAGALLVVFILAATYVPTQLPAQYHRPCGA